MPKRTKEVISESDASLCHPTQDELRALGLDDASVS